MDEKTKEIIAIGASVTARCQDCLKHHIKKAKELNCSEKEISDAIEVGKQVNRGSWSIMDKEIENLKEEEDKSEEESGCGCNKGGCC